MNEKTQLEPGLLKTYRLLTWVLAGISTFQAASIYLRVGFENYRINSVWVFPFGNILVLILLYWPWIRLKTGRFFFPILIALATVSGILQTYLISMMRFNPDATISILVEGARNLTIPFEIYELSLVMASWQLVPILFIPLIMVAWQYNFKAVVGYVAASTLLDVAVFLTLLNVNRIFISAISVVGVLMTRTLTFLVVGFLVSRMIAAQRLHHHELQRANQQLLGYAMTLEQLTTTRERNRLARELHDTLAHTLSGLAVQLAAIKTIWDKDEISAREKLDDAIKTTRSGLNETRRALKSLRASPLEDLGLCLAVQDLAKTAADRCGAVLKLDVQEIPIEIPPDFRQAFYRAAQEALENIVRHSKAEHITLKMAYSDDILSLQINDDGIGFNPQHLDADTYGLPGLQERAELIGGQCVIDSHPEKGTTIQFTAGVLTS
ncbi:MAG: sensor histidine kinase [Chloroflexota bacterium]|nr:sensor histidine kinase [Chloroflexota bacterium]